MTQRLTLPEPIKLIVADARERVERELESNERIKWILAVGILTLYLSFVLYLAGESSDAQSRFIQTQTRLSQLETQITDKGWKQRAADAAQVRDELRSKFWKGDTPGLAEAGFERWIRQTMAEHQIDVRQIQLTRSPVLDTQTDLSTTELSSVQIIRAKAIGSLNESGIVNFLNDASTHESWVVVEQFIARGGRSDRFEMDIATYFKPEQQAP